MANNFHVKKIEQNNITIEEERKEHSAFIWFLINNGRLILTIAILFSLSLAVISLSLFLKDIGETTYVTYEENGVIVKFNGSDDITIGGIPITDSYADDLFDNVLLDKDKNKDGFMDIKEISLENTSGSKKNYIVVIEETTNYSKHDVNKVLSNDYIKYNIYVNNTKSYNNKLNNNLKSDSKYSFDNNTYLLQEGQLESNNTIKLNIGMWVSYEDITNEYMDSAFIGTIKVYVE